jgi:hypothetical protein
VAAGGGLIGALLGLLTHTVLRAANTHRPIDAPTAGAMTDHMLRYLRKAQESAAGLPAEEQSVASGLPSPAKLHWTLSPSLRTAQEQLSSLSLSLLKRSCVQCGAVSDSRP